MEIKAEAKTVSKDTAGSEVDIDVSWILPTRASSWTQAVQYRIESYDGSEDIDWTDIDTVPVARESQVTDSWSWTEWHFFHHHHYTAYQYIIYFRVQLTDANGETGQNIVSFMVTPNSRMVRLTYASSEAAVNSIIYGGWINDAIFNIYPAIAATGTQAAVPGHFVEFSTAANQPVYFWIASDFSSKGWGNVIHYSNSSYCKVTRISPRSIPGRTVEASLMYSIEDLPQNQLSSEDDGYIDYDDVVFYVDIIK